MQGLYSAIVTRVAFHYTGRKRMDATRGPGVPRDIPGSRLLSQQ